MRANQGARLTPQVVIESLGHIGASTKSEGEAIGHKGIGFRSVLEMSSQPELYSGLQNPGPTLAVRFDPKEALDRIKEASEQWDEFVAGTQGLDTDDPLAPVPVLRYPLWVGKVPDEVRELAASGFDTVVRLPFDSEFARRRGVTEQEWLDEIRRALRDDLSDQILLLLGTFSEVQVHDQLDGQDPVTIGQSSRRRWLSALVEGTRRSSRLIVLGGRPRPRAIIAAATAWSPNTPPQPTGREACW